MTGSVPLHPDKASFKSWLPVISLAVAAFVFNTSEFIPVGLLIDIGQSFHQSASETGHMLVIYAWVVSIMSLPLTVLIARCERRRLMLALLLVFIVSHIASGVANSFGFLVASRIGVALSHAVFWSIVTPLAARVAPPGKKGQSLGVVITATSLAMVMGLPLGSIIGHVFGWRWTFFVIGAAALIVFVLIVRLLPVTPSQNAGSLQSLPSLLRRRALLRIYCLTVLTVTGHFTLYSYISPFFLKVGGFTSDWLLLVLGFAGIVGSYISSRRVERYPYLCQIIPLILLVLCLSVAIGAGHHVVTSILLCIVWGASMTAVCLCYQTQVLNIAADATDVAVAMFSSIFNVGIGGGALLGGLVITYLDLEYTGLAGGLFMALALAICALSSIKRHRRAIF